MALNVPFVKGVHKCGHEDTVRDAGHTESLIAQTDLKELRWPSALATVSRT